MDNPNGPYIFASPSLFHKEKYLAMTQALKLGINNHQKPSLTTINLLINNHYNNRRGGSKNMGTPSYHSSY